MTKTVPVLLAWFTLAGVASLQAQTSQGSGEKKIRFVGLNVGAQPHKRTLSTSSSSPLYQESLLINTNHRIGSGAVVGIGGGYQVWRSLVIAGEFTTFSSSGSAQAAASIPNPLFFNQPLDVTISVPNLDRKENAFHLSAMWFVPITEEIDIAFSLGPSFIHVSQDLATTGTVPNLTQDLTLTTTRASGTATGVNVGFEGTYKFTPRYGAALFIRYAGGSLDLPNAPDVASGGFQIGIGGRMRF
jgi:hypothetical protein